MSDTLVAAERASGLSKSTIPESIEAGQIIGTKEPFSGIDEIITKTETEIVAHLDADELQRALLAGQQCSEIPIARSYWFRCLVCKFEWATWLKPSITFISLSFVTERCPNCRRKHVPVFSMATVIR
jgi:hypothetical protein